MKLLEDRLADEIKRIGEIDEKWLDLSEDAKKPKVEQEQRNLKALSDELAKDAADLRSVLDQDENFSNYVDVVLTNFATYLENLPKPLQPDSLALAQEALAENSDRLVSRVLEIQDKKRLVDRLAFVDSELGKLRRKLQDARGKVENIAAEKAAAEKEKQASDKAFRDQKQVQDFQDQCNADAWSYAVDNQTRIDFLGLKSLLDNLYERADLIYKGIPDLSLSQLILTSEFEVTLEVSAGMNTFKFIPVIAAPSADLKTVHTHNLKVTLAGKKNKNAPGNNIGSKNLIASCEQRVSGGTATTDNFCASQAGQLLESILQAVQNNPGGASSSAQ